MRIGLILPSNIWYSPYINIYTKVLKDLRIDYDIVSWNRDGKDSSVGFQYNVRLPYNTTNRVKKFKEYFSYCRFVQRICQSQNFDKLIVFGPQIGIFMGKYLRSKYNKRYIFDYRDLSIEQSPIFSKTFFKVLDCAAAIFISSPGFKSCLPLGHKYNISHNFDIDKVYEAISSPQKECGFTRGYNILTIGGIRDYDANIEVIDALADVHPFKMMFVGKGPASSQIEAYAISRNIGNITFKGFYKKEEEGKFIQESSFLNIYYPKIISHSTALSNRFYNALIYKKPMLVTSGSIQGDYASRYGLGISVDNCSDIDKKLMQYVKNTNYTEFFNNCNNLLSQFVGDYNNFVAIVKSFIKS